MQLPSSLRFRRFAEVLPHPRERIGTLPFHRACGNAEDVGDLIDRTIFEVPQNHDCPLLDRQTAEGVGEVYPLARARRMVVADRGRELVGYSFSLPPCPARFGRGTSDEDGAGVRADVIDVETRPRDVQAEVVSRIARIRLPRLDG